MKTYKDSSVSTMEFTVFSKYKWEKENQGKEVLTLKITFNLK